MLQLLIKRSYKTIKSIHDEEANRALLRRLKKISVSRQHEMKPLPEPVENQDQCDRTLTMDSLEKILDYHMQDPLKWNESVLGRTFNVNENHCVTLCRYVQPFTDIVWRSKPEVDKLIETSMVIDIGLFKRDQTYYSSVHKIAFIPGGSHQVSTKK